MKKIYLLLLAAAVFASCSNKVENAIKDYEQTIGSTKIDLSMSIKKLNKVKEYTGADSAQVIADASKISVDSIPLKVEQYKKHVAESKEKYQLYKDSAQMERNKVRPESYMIMYYENVADIYEPDDNEDAIMAAMEQALYYYNNPEKVLGNLWDCTYTIKNPLLDMKQEISKQYLFNADDTEILATIDND